MHAISVQTFPFCKMFKKGHKFISAQCFEYMFFSSKFGRLVTQLVLKVPYALRSLFCSFLI